MRFNGHPPLGVNATEKLLREWSRATAGFNGHPPLGVNATRGQDGAHTRLGEQVSMGTHPWG